MAQLGRVAEKIAAGNVDAVRTGIPGLAQIDPAGGIVHDALMQGFGWVMLYGGIGVAILALLSFVISGRASRKLA
jgi:hypothetical protein